MENPARENEITEGFVRWGRRPTPGAGHDLWADLESTYSGAGQEENWEALFRMIALLRKTASEVGDRLGYAYPLDLDRRAVAFLKKVKDLIRE